MSTKMNKMECSLCKHWTQKDYHEDWESGVYYWMGWCKKHNKEYPEASICNDFEELRNKESC